MTSSTTSVRAGSRSLLILLSSCLATIVSAAAVPDSVDVAVIGAGLSGLTAARDLLKGGKSVIVLEGRDRVGGKVYNYPLKNGAATEVGAEFVGPTQDKILEMIAELGLETFDTYIDGQTVLYRNNTRTPYTPDPALGGAPPAEQAALVQVGTTRAQLNKWAAELNPSAPWSHPKAVEWDSITVEQYLQSQNLLPDAKFPLDTFTKSVFASKPDELSLLYFLAYTAAAGNETNVGTLDRLLATTDGAQEKRVVGGTGLIPQRLAEKLGAEHIAFNAAVSCVTKTSTGYKIKSRAGNVHAKEVVLAMAPPLLQQIKFKPELPSKRQQLNRHMKMPSIGKGVPIYKTPFWRQDGLSGQVLSDANPVRTTFDSTPEDKKFGAILGFILADEMRALDKLSPAECQKQLLATYVKYFGDKAADVEEFVLQRWDLEEFSMGGPVAVAPPNVLTKYGSALRESVGGLHFAGTETSEFWTGYMDGAVRSGERVAKEILGA